MPQTYRSLAQFFDRSGQTREDVAARLGVSVSYISLLVARKRQPSLPLALRIESLTGVPAASLVSRQRTREALAS